MSENSWDETDHDLFQPALQQLYVEELEELGGESCRNLLNEIIADHWGVLAAQACRRHQRSMPSHEDAFLGRIICGFRHCSDDFIRDWPGMERMKPAR